MYKCWHGLLVLNTTIRCTTEVASLYIWPKSVQDLKKVIDQETFLGEKCTIRSQTQICKITWSRDALGKICFSVEWIWKQGLKLVGPSQAKKYCIYKMDNKGDTFKVGTV